MKVCNYFAGSKASSFVSDVQLVLECCQQLVGEIEKSFSFDVNEKRGEEEEEGEATENCEGLTRDQ